MSQSNSPTANVVPEATHKQLQTQSQIPFPMRMVTILTRIPLREHWSAIAAYALVFIIALVTRFYNLGIRPLHFDESEHAYYALILLQNNIQQWFSCFNASNSSCYHYNPITHGPFQFHAIAFVYLISKFLGAADNGINTTTVRIAAATMGSVLVMLPYFLRSWLSNVGAWLTCLLMALSPSLIYYSRFAREDIYMACFTLLLVIATAHYLRTHQGRWLLLAASSFMLTYATKESAFLLIAVFGSFLGAVLAWELGIRWSWTRLQEKFHADQSNAFSKLRLLNTGAPLCLLLYTLVLVGAALCFFYELKLLTAFITNPQNTPTADTFVAQLKYNTELILPWLGILLAFFVFFLLMREIRSKIKESHLEDQDMPDKHSKIQRHIDSQRQPWLTTIVTMPWQHWFSALVCASFIFVMLFTVLFTYVPQGIGDGAWQGLYYWLQQQSVARGGQPWYYYLLLIPLYEQIGVVFGLIGIVRCLLKPTRFRLFLVFWFVGNLCIYSWAGEKMPWLTIHILLPLFMLAAIALEPATNTLLTLCQQIGRDLQHWFLAKHAQLENEHAPAHASKRVWSALAVLFIALLTLISTITNVIQVNYIHAADANDEMLIYVQTTPAINTIMAKIALLDTQRDHGLHQVTIGVTEDATYPLIWYLRDYPNVCYSFPNGCPYQVDVILTSDTQKAQIQQQYSQSYAIHVYHLFDQWDQGYMPPPCQQPCTQQYSGVGPLLWLSYGDHPPQHASFNPLLAAQRIWRWWWQRQPIGQADGGGYTGISLFIRKGIGISP
ncbi:hypothetical protein ccbrp13_09500 [Ktedonobacteria bacterium brp13]|nr:hypothetical protein ccbrp13_09500 [Ktedonobacteria bacterium brp13]